MIKKRKTENTTTWTIAARRLKLNFSNIIPSPDPEPKNKRTSRKTNCNGIKKGCLCSIFKPAMVLES